MEIKTKKRTKRVQVEYTVYISSDGKEFESESECKRYEEQNRERLEKIKKVEKMEIPELKDLTPINCDCEPSECNEFSWYKLEDEKQFKLLNEHYERSLRKPQWYPTFYCVETEYSYGHGYGCDACGCYSQADLEDKTRKFWSELGYDVTLTKRGE